MRRHTGDIGGYREIQGLTGDTGGDRGYREYQGIQGVTGDTGGDRGYRE